MRGKNPWDDDTHEKERQNSENLGDNLKNTFKSKMKKTQPYKKGIFYVFAGAVLLSMFSTILFKVDYDQRGVVLRFGKWVRTLSPGLQYKLPYPFEQVILCRVTSVNQIDIGLNSDKNAENLVLTGDSNLASFSYSVLWKIKEDKVEDFLFNAKRPEVTIYAVSESVMREIIGQSDFSYVQTDGRSDIQMKALAGIQNILDEYKLGVEIVKVSLQKVEPPASVVDSFRDVERAQADQQSECNTAEAYARDRRARTRGLIAEKINQAEARKAELIAAAQGATARFTLGMNSYKHAPDIISKVMTLDTYKSMYTNSKKILVDKDIKSLQHIFLPQSFLEKQQSAQNEGEKQ